MGDLGYAIQNFCEKQGFGVVRELVGHGLGKTMHEAAKFVSEKLATMSGVTSTATHFMMKTYKLNGIEMYSGDKDERLKISP